MHQLDFIGASPQGKVKNRVFVKLGSGYADYFPGYSGYFGRTLILLKYIYEMDNYGN